MDDGTESVSSSIFTTAADLLENPHHKNYEFIQKCMCSILNQNLFNSYSNEMGQHGYTGVHDHENGRILKKG